MSERSAIMVAEDGSWVEVTVHLDNGRLSITGAAGDSATRGEAKKMALQYWESYFDESPDARREMGERFDRKFRTSLSAARFVIQSDGEFHGLDVHSERDGKVLLARRCGQIREDIAPVFPEVVPYFRWHLNNMKDECPHQEARGETYATHPGVECPDCNYKLGSAWLKRELPPEVVAWAESFGE